MGKQQQQQQTIRHNLQQHLQSHHDFIIWPCEGILYFQTNYEEYALLTFCSHNSNDLIQKDLK